MDSNTQLNEDYKFRFAYVVELVKDMFSTSGEVEDKELKNRIEKIRQEQDNAHMASLEKEIETHEVSRKRKSTRNSAKETVNSNTVKENVINETILENNDVVLDEEKDR